MSRSLAALIVALVLAASGWSLFGWEVSHSPSGNAVLVQQRDPCENAVAAARWYTTERGALIPAEYGATNIAEGERGIFEAVIDACLTDSLREP